MAQVQHTPGPWELDIEEYGFQIRMGSAVPYTGIYEPQHVIEWDPGVYPSEDQDEADAEHRQYLEAKANMERIVAAVNAVEGIPTEALEAGVVREMVEALEWFMRRSGLDEGDEGDGLLIPAGDTAEIKRRFGAALERVRGGDRSA